MLLSIPFCPGPLVMQSLIQRHCKAASDGAAPAACCTGHQFEMQCGQPFSFLFFQHSEYCFGKLLPMACRLTQELTCLRCMSCWRRTIAWSVQRAAQRRSTNSCEHVSLPHPLSKTYVGIVGENTQEKCSAPSCAVGSHSSEANV
jgi:hypothetical protein